MDKDQTNTKFKEARNFDYSDGSSREKMFSNKSNNLFLPYTFNYRFLI